MALISQMHLRSVPGKRNMDQSPFQPLTLSSMRTVRGACAYRGICPLRSMSAIFCFTFDPLLISICCFLADEPSLSTSGDGSGGAPLTARGRLRSLGSEPSSGLSRLHGSPSLGRPPCITGDALHISSALLQHATEQLQRHSGSLNRELEPPHGTRATCDAHAVRTICRQWLLRHHCMQLSDSV